METFHLAFAALAVAINIAVLYYVRDKGESHLLKLLWGLGLVMMIAEVFKQWFCYKYIFGGQISLVYFPWQLCSIAMYLAFAAKYLKGKSQDAALVYLGSFSLLGAVMALVFPGEMLLEGTVFMIHSFIYHALIISGSIIAVEILRKRERRPSFAPALCLFLITAAIAEAINVLGKLLIDDPSREPDMFYISPFYPTSQHILSDIAGKIGVLPEVILYMCSIMLASYLIYLAEDRALFSGKVKS